MERSKGMKGMGLKDEWFLRWESDDTFKILDYVIC